jgi:hypothetical protein
MTSKAFARASAQNHNLVGVDKGACTVVLGVGSRQVGSARGDAHEVVE